jgi:RNA polymerase sigma factor (TIGR02999 family)
MESGALQSAEELLPVVYGELRRIAARKMALESPGHTLQPTALVHEAWMSLAAIEGAKFKNSAQFFTLAGEAMRRILVDRARRKRSLKRGAGAAPEPLHEHEWIVEPASSDELLAVDEALELLARQDAVSADLVKLRYFVGMNMEQAAEALELPLRTAERTWAFARAWLRKTIQANCG